MEHRNDSLIFTAQAASILGVSAETVRYYVRTGRLQALRVSRIRLFYRDAVEQLARDQQAARTPVASEAARG